MLKGVTKTAYVMDTLFKHVEKLPKELQPKQLMSDLNAAMTFFGDTTSEFREKGHFDKIPHSAVSNSFGIHTRRFGRQCRFHPYDKSSNSV